jgi:hypothetical protein
MIDPYRMVFVNIVALLLVIIGTLFYTYIYPKKKVNLFALLVIISLLPLISILRKGSFESGGFTDYVKFSISFYQSLKEGILVPQWDAFRCGGYGCPQFLFMYTLPYYFVSFFHFLGMSLVGSIKLLLALTYFFSGLTMYFFVKDWLGKTSAFVAAIFYLFAPYHFVDMHFRTDIAEVLCFVFLPIQFWAAKKVIEGASWKWIGIGAVNIVLLIMSHQAISLSAMPFVFAFGIFLWLKNKKRQLKNLLAFFITFILGLLLSTFYWLPILIESKNIFWGIHGNILFVHPWTMFFFSPWLGGFLYQGHYGELSFILGYMHWFVIATAVYFLIKKRIITELRPVTIFLLIAFTVFFFMMFEVSKPIWEITPIINKFQFSYRFLIFLSFIASLIGAILVKNIKNKWIIIIICFLTISITILNWGHRRTIPEIDDVYLKRELLTSTPLFEVTIPEWIDYKINPPPSLPEKKIELLDGNATIVARERTTTKHSYQIDVKETATFRENTFYFPGWNLLVNNKPHPFSYRENNGVINFSLPNGSHTVDLVFTNTKTVSFAQTVSLLTLIVVLFVSGYYLVKRGLRLLKKQSK